MRFSTDSFAFLFVVGMGLMVTSCGDPAKDAKSIEVRGSDTMVHMVTEWAEAYMKENPEDSITVNGGGSGTGISAMINGTVDLAMASRAAKDKEKEQGKENGKTFHEITMARDGIAIIVHEANPVTELTMDQLRQIFNGTLTNWNQVGGADQKITILSRESSSGTYGFFNEHVLKKDNFAASARLLSGNQHIVDACKADKGGVGYVGLGYSDVKGIKVVGVKANAEAAPTKPSISTVNDGSYPVARPLFIYSDGPPDGLAKKFVEYALSDKGQSMVEKMGYVPLR